MYYDNHETSELVGKTLRQILISDDNDELRLTTDTGEVWSFRHDQDCCENVYLADVCGDLSDLIGTPLIQADEESNSDDPPVSDDDESYTWTFYKFATNKGGVTIRWYGSSSGYYSERVSLNLLSSEAR